MDRRVLSLTTQFGAKPRLALGTTLAVIAIGLETAGVYPLEHVVGVSSLAVVYLPGVIAIAILWGTRLGLTTAVASALAYNFFHLRPVGVFTLSDSRTWVAMAALVLVGASAGELAALARVRGREAELRRREGDLTAEIARVLLGRTRVDVALAATAQRVASALGLTSAAIELGDVPAGRRRVGFALREPGHERVIGTLILPASLDADERARIASRVVPALQSVLAAALHRAELQSEVVETAALRRNDEMKTAVLRSVSHDLRTPLTAILTAASAIDPESAGASEAAEAQAVVIEAAQRLSGLVEKLLDLSRLQAGNLEHRSDACSIEDVLHEAVAAVATTHPDQRFRVVLDGDLPLIFADAGQLERAFANLLENAARYAAGKPVVVRAGGLNGGVRVRIVDQGPGIRASEVERIFLPFYRSPDDQPAHQGSGLGLAIAKGFVEVNGGAISVESLPNQGTTFSVELPSTPPPAARRTRTPARRSRRKSTGTSTDKGTARA